MSGFSGKLQTTFRAFKYRNYRLFFAGQGLSAVGTLMQQTAQGWLVYRLTNSPLMLGIVAFAGQIPNFFLTPIAGLLSDRNDRRSIILIADIVQMIMAFILAALILTNTVQAWHIIVLSAVVGISGAFEMTTRHSLVPQMVDDKADVGNAIALNSVMFNMARLIGPPLAGLTVAWLGEGMCFVINGFSFIAVIIALLMMDLIRRVEADRKDPIKELEDGFKYVFESIPMRTIIILMAFVSLTGSAVIVLLPVFARDILHGGPQTYGLLIGSQGLGAIIGALYMASRKTVRRLTKVILFSVFYFGIGLIAVSISGSLIMAVIFLMIAGTGTMIHMASSNTIIQTVADDDKRGRAVSFYILSFSGFVPIGNLIAGWAAGRFGVRQVVACGGILTVMAGLIFSLILPEVRRRLKNVYIKKGIIPVDPGVEIK
jgi:MFS family permease